MNNVAIGALALAGVGVFLYSNRASAETDAATHFLPPILIFRNINLRLN